MQEQNQQNLNSDFIVELAKSCLTNNKILEICKSHLKYQYLSNESQKNVFKFIFDTYDVTATVPTIGVIGQNFNNHQETISFLSQMKKTNRVDNPLLLIDQLEDYIKKIRYQQLLEQSVRLFNEGKKDESYLFLQKESEAINTFSFKQNAYIKLFEDFEKRNDERLKKASETQNHKLEKCPFGIHQLDEDTLGGIKKGTAALLMARSGKGKSTFMRWTGLHNARLGQRVVHFQIEGSANDTLELYDAGWTGVLTEKISIGSIDDLQKRKIEKARRDILTRGGEIYVYASETFDSMSIEESRDILLDIENIHGKIDLIIYDYLEILTTKGNFSSESGERRRRETVANKLTNVAIEFDAAVLTATQANDISPTDYNNPNFNLTRHHISEFKGAIKPFSYFITINQTDEQANEGLAVLYEDKFRHHRAGRRIPICQALNIGRFYDSAKTLQEFTNVSL